MIEGEEEFQSKHKQAKKQADKTKPLPGVQLVGAPERLEEARHNLTLNLPPRKHIFFQGFLDWAKRHKKKICM